jgi:ATP-dependent RNA helicase DeaD
MAHQEYSQADRSGAAGNTPGEIDAESETQPGGFEAHAPIAAELEDELEDALEDALEDEFEEDALLAGELEAEELADAELDDAELEADALLDAELEADALLEAELDEEDELEEDELEEDELEEDELEEDELEEEELLAEQPEENGFRKLGLNDRLLQALESSGYTQPTPIQAESIPILLAGRDLVGQAQTGTGKTAAFALPLLQRIVPRNMETQVLVLTPTRELAIQVGEAFERYAGGPRALNIATIYGGQDYMVQFRQLERGAQVVVGTPGRVMDHMRRGSLALATLKTLVLDEADEMLRMGFAEDVEWILQATPAQRQIALFSATMPEPIRRIAQQYLRDPQEVTIQQRAATADTIRQRYVVALPGQKEAVLARILEAEPVDGVIVFVKTKSTTEPLAEFLTHSGLRAAALHGDIAQRQRERIVDQLRNGKLNVIVATDVAARGLDVQRISHVINYDLPFDHEAYVHRIGRTGRAGRSGEAILFVGPRDRGKLRRLEYATRQKIEPMEIPGNRAINKQRVLRFHERITKALGHPEVETFQSIIEQYRRDNDVPFEQIAAALAAMAQGKKAFLARDEVRTIDFDADARNRRETNPRDPRARRGRYGEEGEGREQRGGRRKVEFSPEQRLVTYRIEVGHAHQVKPGNIVGAIANEAGIDSAFIGRIEIFERFSTVDLPGDLPPELLEALGNAKIGGRPLRIAPVGGSRPAGGGFRPGPRSRGPQGEARAHGHGQGAARGGHRPGGSRSGPPRGGRSHHSDDRPAGPRGPGKPKRFRPKNGQ